MPDAKVMAHVPEAGVCSEEDDSETNSHQSFEKQGSLIPLAWSKQTQDETDCMVVVGDEEAAQSQDTLGSIGILAQSNPLEENAQEKDGDEASAQHNVSLHICSGRKKNSITSTPYSILTHLFDFFPPLF